MPDEEGNGLEEISKSATAASKAKNSFSDANENVQKSIDESVPKLQAEADLFKGIADNAKAAANAKEKFAKANNSVEMALKIILIHLRKIIQVQKTTKIIILQFLI